MKTQFEVPPLFLINKKERDKIYKVKKEETLIDKSCDLLGNINLKTKQGEIEVVELIAGLLYEIESYKESIKNLKKKLKTK